MSAARAARVWLLAVALGWASWAGAQVAVPPLTGHVVDRTATLTSEQAATLEHTLQAFEARKGSQLAVLIVPTTAPETIEQYGVRVGEQWKLGRKKVDDGAILLVAKDDHALRIEVGYGLEGALTDATSKRIIDELIVPRFKQGDFNGGVSVGIDQMIKIVDGESLPPPAPQAQAARNAPSLQHYAPVLLILAVVVGGFLRSILGRFPGAIVTGGAVGLVAWFFVGAISIAVFAGVIALVFTLISGTAGSGIINSMGGGGGFGGGRGGGGGFSGGGGGFGGGGASGNW